ncbi:hypothetical protein ACFCYX_23830 [Streptomyces populi]|uniref:hypothetical protein n=1 Tax=Streptomyces populi TaxID=2058924 RepID=UPI0013A6F039|nr:hypothetical protein [Streptomyces populi]
MPSTPLRVHVSRQRACPACGDVKCANPAQCLYFLTSRPWGDCLKCGGSGWASEDSDPLEIFCRHCLGSGLDEYRPGDISPDQISDAAKMRHAAHIARLTTLVTRFPARRLAVTA